LLVSEEVQGGENKHMNNKSKIVSSAAALLAAAGLLFAAGCGGTAHTATPAAQTATGAASPAVTATAAPVTPIAPPTTSGPDWMAGHGGTLLYAVQGDMSTVSTDAQALDVGAAEVDGQQLATDAQAALEGPMPPVDAKDYRSAMKNFELAGQAAASGDFATANMMLTSGSADISKVTAAFAAANGS
jgi:hypothetical protein